MRPQVKIKWGEVRGPRWPLHGDKANDLETADLTNGARKCHIIPTGLPSLLYNVYRVIPGGKAAGAWC
jgi:hypothetical protein